MQTKIISALFLLATLAVALPMDYYPDYSGTYAGYSPQSHVDHPDVDGVATAVTWEKFAACLTKVCQDGMNDCVPDCMKSVKIRTLKHDSSDIREASKQSEESN